MAVTEDLYRRGSGYARQLRVSSSPGRLVVCWSCAEVLQPNQWKVDREKGLLGVASCRMARIARTRGIGRDATGRHMHPPTRRPEGKVVGLYSGSDAIRCACGVDTHVLKWTTRRREADLTCRAAQYSHCPFLCMQSRTPHLIQTWPERALLYCV